jgi:hypothetical protein
MRVPLLIAYQDWYCPNCPVTDRTRPLPPGSSRFHPCGGLHGLNAPLVRAGTRAAVVAEERQDYLNGDIQATGDDGKAYMAVRTVYDDHDDLVVNAGLAHADLRT